MQKRILFMLIFGVGLLACAQAFAGPATEVKASPLFQASLEASIARLEGTPVAAAGAAAAAEDAESEADTHRPECPKPRVLETDGSGNTCQSSCNGTCGSTCGGSYTCGGSTCGGNTCSSTCASTCAPGACQNYRFKGTNYWDCPHYSPSSNWTYIFGMPHGFFINTDENRVLWDDEGSWRSFGPWNVGNGYYDKTITRTTTTAGYTVHSGVTYWYSSYQWTNSELFIYDGSTSLVNTNNFVHQLIY